ncbi:MAG TPA: GAF domain-containing protein [Solirubrobacteraceae bacterium]|nr:GAF domain-containing protein [Solirubrobacteraceae bacterium]
MSRHDRLRPVLAAPARQGSRDGAFGPLLRVVIATLDVATAAIFVAEPEAGSPRVVAAQGAPAPDSTGQAALVRTAMTHDEAWRCGGAGVAAAAPIRGEDGVIGVLWVGAHQGRARLANDELRLLSAVADSVASVLEPR